VSLWLPGGASQAAFDRAQRRLLHNRGRQSEEEDSKRQAAQGGVRADANSPVTGSLEFHAGMVGYIAMVASLIEGRSVREEEIVQRLVRAMRQHSMARRRRMDYVVAQLKKNGP
jgi:hypothetical protein